MTTAQTTAAKKTSTRKIAAAAKFSEAALAAAAAEDNAAPQEAVPAPADPAKVGAGLAKAKAATKRASRAKVVKGADAQIVAEAPAAETAAPTAPAKPARAKRGAKKAEEPEFVPMVVLDENKHTAIAVAANGRTIEIIPMDSAGLSVTKLSRDRFAHEYKPMVDYPVSKAAKVYLTQTIALDPKAKAVLEVLAAAEADKPIASGELVALMSRHDETATVTVPLENGGAAGEERHALATEGGKGKRGAKAAAPKKERKPLGRSSVDKDKVLKAGDVDYKAKVRPDTFRFALMRAIVTCAAKGGKVGDVLGQVVQEGKPGVAAIDINFAVQCGYVAFA